MKKGRGGEEWGNGQGDGWWVCKAVWILLLVVSLARYVYVASPSLSLSLSLMHTHTYTHVDQSNHRRRLTTVVSHRGGLAQHLPWSMSVGAATSAKPTPGDGSEPHPLTSVRVQDLIVVEAAGASGEQQDRRRHVGLLPGPAGHVGHRHLPQRGLLVGARAPRRHLRRENARREHVDADPGPGEGGGQHAAQVQEGGFRRRVGDVPVRGVLQQRRIAAGVDDAGRVTGDHVVALGEERQEGHGHEEAAGDVRLERLGPVLGLGSHEVRADGLRVAEVRLAGSVEPGGIVAGDAGVVDEELDAVGLRVGDGGGELLDGGFVADVGGDAIDDVRPIRRPTFVGNDGGVTCGMIWPRPVS